MTGAQYKNVIKWSILQNFDLKHDSSLPIIKIIFNNLGVAYPNADQAKAVEIIKKNNCLGWRKCTINESQMYANKGVPAIAANDEKLILISPDEDIGDLSIISDIERLNVDFIKTIFELSDTEIKSMSFFTYCHDNRKIIENSKLRRMLWKNY